VYVLGVNVVSEHVDVYVIRWLILPLFIHMEMNRGNNYPPLPQRIHMDMNRGNIDPQYMDMNRGNIAPSTYTTDVIMTHHLSLTHTHTEATLTILTHGQEQRQH
jgi:hypothetical protein